jgi:hypothetical protein
MSSSISSVGYSPDSKTLEIEFNWGGIYQYHNVPENVYSRLLESESPGEFFEKHINKSGFEFEKIG